MSATRFRLVVFPAVVLAIWLALVPGMASAQQPARTQRTLKAVVPDQADARNANEVRNELRDAMQQYPPTLGEVLKLDPSLMTNDAYLQTYPALGPFLAAHPEIARDPAFYFDFVRTARDVQRDYDRAPRSAVADQVRDIFTFLAVASAVGGIAFVLIWLVRTILAHRRWLRATKLQMELHNRLMERLTSSADVQTYLESAATNRLLLDVPVMADGTPTRASVPASRIIWSIQAGIVLGMAGIGLLVGQRYWPGVDGSVITVPGVLILAVGVGFVLASAASYILSNRLGLLDPPSGAGSDRPRA